jgi:VIT1/CCC1 family predicted Fe2+/Mn2+ transporter
MLMSSVDRSVSDVLKDIFRDLHEIARSEIRLAKAQLSEELRKAQTASVLVGIGALSGVLSAFFVLLMIVYALSRVMPDWASALVVAIALAIFAGVMLGMGLGRFKTRRSTEGSIVSLEEIAKWTTEPTK